MLTTFFVEETGLTKAGVNHGEERARCRCDRGVRGRTQGRGLGGTRAWIGCAAHQQNHSLLQELPSQASVALKSLMQC